MRLSNLPTKLSRAAEDDSPATRADLAWQPFYILIQRGELEEARRRWKACAEFVDQSDVQARAAHRWSEAVLLIAERRPAEAIAPAEEMLASSLGVGHWTTKAGLEVGLEAAAALGDAEKVDELLSLIESAPPGHLSPYVRALGARFDAHRATGQGDSATASAGFGAAADLLREIEKPFELAVVLLEHAEWLAAEGTTEDAGPPTDEAREIFERLRAAPWLERLDRIPLRFPEAVVEVGYALRVP
jgi:hypothetical protein